MIKNISAVLIWSEDYRKLAGWYEKTLELKPLEELTHPKDTGIGFQVGHVYLLIGQHDKIKGENKDEHRHMINFVVDSVSESYEKLQKKGVVFLAKPFMIKIIISYNFLAISKCKNLLDL